MSYVETRNNRRRSAGSKKFFAWALFTLALAVVFHFIVVWRIPSVMTTKNVEAILARKKTGEYNRLFYNDLSYAGTDLVVMSNADMRSSIGFYDVSDKPVKIRCVVPNTGNYWSISLYAWNTDNFYVRNDRNAPGREFDLVIVKTNSKYRKLADEEVVVSPTGKGVVLMRYIVADRSDSAELLSVGEEQKKSAMQTIETNDY